MADDKKISEFEISTTLNEAYFAGYMTGDTVNNWQFSVSLFDARYYTQSSGLPANAITGGTFNDARVAQSNVTQHNAALSHSLLTSASLSADDHSQYHNDSRALTWLGSQGAAIKTAYEAEADTNAFTDAEKTKLSGIAAGATVGATWGVNITSQPTLSTVATSGAYSDLSGKPTLGTAAALNVGTGANQVVQLDGSGHLPAVDGSALTNLPAAGSALTDAQVSDRSSAVVGSVSGAKLDKAVAAHGIAVVGTKKSSGWVSKGFQGNGNDADTALLQAWLTSLVGTVGGRAVIDGDFPLSTELTLPICDRLIIESRNEGSPAVFTATNAVKTAIYMIHGNYNSATNFPQVELRNFRLQGWLSPKTSSTWPPKITQVLPVVLTDGDAAIEPGGFRGIYLDEMYSALIEAVQGYDIPGMGITTSGGWSTIVRECLLNRTARDSYRVSSGRVLFDSCINIDGGDDSFAINRGIRSTVTMDDSNSITTYANAREVLLHIPGHQAEAGDFISIHPDDEATHPTAGVVNGTEITGTFRILRKIGLDDILIRSEIPATSGSTTTVSTLQVAFNDQKYKGPRDVEIKNCQAYGGVSLRVLGPWVANIHDNEIWASKNFSICGGYTQEFDQGTVDGEFYFHHNKINNCSPETLNRGVLGRAPIYILSKGMPIKRASIHHNTVNNVPAVDMNIGNAKWSDLRIGQVAGAATAKNYLYTKRTYKAHASRGTEKWMVLEDPHLKISDGDPFANYGICVIADNALVPGVVDIERNTVVGGAAAARIRGSFTFRQDTYQSGTIAITIPAGSTALGTGISPNEANYRITSKRPARAKYVMTDMPRTNRYTGYIDFDGVPSANSTITLSGTVVTFVASGETGNQSNITPTDLSATIAHLVARLNASADAGIAKCLYYQRGPSRLYIYNKTDADSSVTLAASDDSYGTVSGASLTAGGANATMTINGQSCPFNPPNQSGTNTATVQTTNNIIIVPGDIAATLDAAVTAFNASSNTTINAYRYSREGNALCLSSLTDGVLATLPYITCQTAANLTLVGSDGWIFTAQPAVSSTFSVDEDTWTAVSSAPVGKQFVLGANQAATQANLAAALNASTSAATARYTYTVRDSKIIAVPKTGTLRPVLACSTSPASNATVGVLFYGDADYLDDIAVDLRNWDYMRILIDNASDSHTTATRILWLAYSIDGGATFKSLRAGDWGGGTTNGFQLASWNTTNPWKSCNGSGETQRIPADAQQVSKTIIRVLGQSGDASPATMNIDKIWLELSKSPIDKYSIVESTVSYVGDVDFGFYQNPGAVNLATYLPLLIPKWPYEIVGLYARHGNASSTGFTFTLQKGGVSLGAPFASLTCPYKDNGIVTMYEGRSGIIGMAGEVISVVISARDATNIAFPNMVMVKVKRITSQDKI